MRKNKLKNYIKLGAILFGIMLTCLHCQKDDETFEVDSTTPQSNLNFTTLKTKEIETNTNLMRIINKAEKKVSDNKAGKTVYNEIYDFTINTHYAKVITHSNGLKNYTFGVYRVEDNGLLENVLLEEQADHTFKVFLVQYTITETEKNSLINREIVNLDDKITFTPLDDISDTIFSKVNSDAETCTVYSYDWYTGNTCNAGGNHTYQEGAACKGWGNPDLMATSGGWVLTANQESCGDGGGSTNTSGNPNGNPSGSQSGGYGSGTNYVPPKTTPALCPTCPLIGEDDQDPHIESLNKIVAIPKIKTELHRLKTSMGFSTQEDGKRFIYTGDAINNPDTYSDATFTSQEPTGSESDALFFPPLEDNTLIGAHFHPDLDSSIPPQPIRKVPSGTDLAEHIVMVKAIAAQNPTSSPNINQVTNFVVSKGNSGKTYAIRTNNEESIVNLQGDYAVEGEKRIELADELRKIIIKINPNDTAAQEQAIANFIAENLPGLSLYVAVYNSEGEIINWIKL